METIGWLALNFAFGALCGLYVTVVGFTLSALLIVGASLIFCKIFAAPISMQIFLLSYVALQLGYFGSLITQSLTRHLALLKVTPRSKDRDPMKTAFSRDRD